MLHGGLAAIDALEIFLVLFKHLFDVLEIIPTLYLVLGYGIGLLFKLYLLSQIAKPVFMALLLVCFHYQTLKAVRVQLFQLFFIFVNGCQQGFVIFLVYNLVYRVILQKFDNALVSVFQFVG